MIIHLIFESLDIVSNELYANNLFCYFWLAEWKEKHFFEDVFEDASIKYQYTCLSKQRFDNCLLQYKIQSHLDIVITCL
jgi:hypothetical protein